MMRTTLSMDQYLLTQLKQIAAGEHRSLAALVNEALRDAVAQRLRPVPQPPVELPVFGSGGVAQGIDLSNTRALLEYAEENLPLEKRG